MKKKIRILIVDDSAVVRATLQELFANEEDLEVIGTASDPFKAAKLMQQTVPDVITLDLEMPRMDGLTFLRKLMHQHPIPVVVCSSLAQKGAEAALQALEYGAVEVIAKPHFSTHEFLLESKALLCDSVRAAAMVRVKTPPPELNLIGKVLPVSDLQRQRLAHNLRETTDKFIVVGASTGGTEALKTYLQGMPANCPGILAVQHMPANFTASFAARLDGLCDIHVKEAKDGDSVLPGQALIAPGGKHLTIKRNGARYVASVNDGPLVNRHRPSVDMLFRSAAAEAGANTVAVIMTGMGNDGAQGCVDLKESGATVLAQDEASCVVFGMPRCAIEKGGTHKVLPIQKLASATLSYFKPKQDGSPKTKPPAATSGHFNNQVAAAVPAATSANHKASSALTSLSHNKSDGTLAPNQTTPTTP